MKRKLFVLILPMLLVAYFAVPSEGPHPQRSGMSQASGITVNVSRDPTAIARYPIGRLSTEVQPHFYKLVMRIAVGNNCLTNVIVCRGVWDDRRDRRGEMLYWPDECPRAQVARSANRSFMLRWYFFDDPRLPAIASNDGFPRSMPAERRREFLQLPECPPDP